MSYYKQIILFGSPGTGKSHKVKNEILPSLRIVPDSNNSIRTVFHPEYTYGDFMGKLLPLTKDKQVEYRYYQGAFLKSLARAYENILNASDDSPLQNVALTIDEINRGNSAAIFGMVFQLLDRESDGWSTYTIDVSDMEFGKLLDLIGFREVGVEHDYGKPIPTYRYKDKTYRREEFDAFLQEKLKIKRNQIRIPNNLSIVATMNTSDSSIYYMDSAFKRRWDWEYVNINHSTHTVEETVFTNRNSWEKFVDKLNNFIKSNYQFVRKAEDKQIGYWFIQKDEIKKSDVQNKVMFFIWDSVFTTSKVPVNKLLDLKEEEIVTFGDFANQVDLFVEKINKL